LAADHAPTPGPSSHRDHARGEDQAFPTNSTKSKVRAKVEHAIGVIKRVFGFAKVRYRGLRKNEHRLVVTCAPFCSWQDGNYCVSKRRSMPATREQPWVNAQYAITSHPSSPEPVLFLNGANAVPT
jgi:hypothetical protein